MLKASLIIVCYNSFLIIEECLSSLIDSRQFPVYFVDNASTDGSAEKLIARYPNAKVLIQERNLGYGRAANVALNNVQTDYALLLNPDILMTADQVLELIDKSEDFSDAALLVPATSQKHQLLDSGSVDQDKVSGSCMMFQMDNLRKVGFFDEKIFLFSEETDLCIRILEAGLRIIMFPGIYVRHLAGKSSGHSDAVEYMKEWHFGWSRSYYYQKHGLDQGSRSLKRRLFLYKWKSLKPFIGRKKKIKYSAIFEGIRAFKMGEAAFAEDGSPKVNPCSELNPYRV